MSQTDRVIYLISKGLVNYMPILLGAFMFCAACVGYGKPLVKWYIRLLVGAMGFLLLFLGMRQLIFSK
ncbi:MAG: hypothetical protein WAN60_18115 [Candidatus Sulfotelmatobacter sp.]|jgi:hypothetical protein